MPHGDAARLLLRSKVEGSENSQGGLEAFVSFVGPPAVLRGTVPVPHHLVAPNLECAHECDSDLVDTSPGLGERRRMRECSGNAQYS